MELYAHNVKPYEELKTIQAGECSVFVTATGTGKSYVAGKLIEESDKRVLIITPRRAISSQWERLLSEQLHRVDVWTYQRLSRISEKQYKKVFEPYGIMVVDEVHHAGAESWGRPIDYAIKHAAELNLSVIGLTADPVRYSDGGYDVCAELFKGNRVDGLLLEEAIQQKVLPEFNYVSALYDFPSDIRGLAGRKQRASKNNATESTLNRLLGRLRMDMDNMKRIVDIVKDSVADSPTSLKNRHLLVFVASNDDYADAEKFVKKLGFKAIYTMTYKQSKKKNAAALDAFGSVEGGAALICVDMLNEGVHCRAVDTVVMLRRTTSPNIFFQQLGRALDSGSQKDIWVFDFVANAKALSMNNAMADERLVPVSSIIRKCCAQKITKDYATECLQLIYEIRCLLADKAVWTEEEDNILRQNYPTEGEKCFELLGQRSTIACYMRCSALGLKMDGWTDAEDEIMRKYYASEGYSITKRLNGKTQSAVSNRARKLGLLYEPEEWSDADIAILKEYYPSEGTALAPRLSKEYSVPQIKYQARKHGFTYNRNLWSKKEQDIVRLYYPDREKCLENLPGRTWQAICRQAKITGVAKSAPEQWTDDEITFLKNNKASMTNKEIGDALGRTAGAVKMRYRHLMAKEQENMGK